MSTCKLPTAVELLTSAFEDAAVISVFESFWGVSFKKLLPLRALSPFWVTTSSLSAKSIRRSMCSSGSSSKTGKAFSTALSLVEIRGLDSGGVVFYNLG